MLLQLSQLVLLPTRLWQLLQIDEVNRSAGKPGGARGSAQTVSHFERVEDNNRTAVLLRSFGSNSDQATIAIHRTFGHLCPDHNPCCPTGADSPSSATHDIVWTR